MTVGVSIDVDVPVHIHLEVPVQIALTFRFMRQTFRCAEAGTPREHEHHRHAAHRRQVLHSLRPEQMSEAQKDVPVRVMFASFLKPERGCTPVLSPNSDRDDLMPPRQSRRCTHCCRFTWATASGSGGLGIAPACDVRRGKAGPHRRSFATGEVTDVPIRATGGRPRDRCVALLMPVYTARSSARHRDNLAPLWSETTDPRAWKSAQNERLASNYASTSWLRRPNARGPAVATSLSLHITIGRCVLALLLLKWRLST